MKINVNTIKDAAVRAAWTFAQAGGAVLVASGTNAVHVSTLEAAGVAGLAAVFSLSKTTAVHWTANYKALKAGQPLASDVAAELLKQLTAQASKNSTAATVVKEVEAVAKEAAPLLDTAGNPIPLVTNS